ncbi:MAG TPA: DUF169 domain-containing protein [Dehalococcoidia bacterium]|nr:DUF169 domain-containing protein [Dehalococcoidia bacterium]
MDTKQMNDMLNTYVRPQTFPLALKLCKSESELPERVRIPVRDMGYQITLCQGYGIARRFRWAVAIGKDDQCCVGGASTMGFIGERPNEEPAKRLETGKYSHLLIAPIEMADFEPDLLLLYVNSAQAMRLSQAASRSADNGVSAIATGFGDCGDIVARTTTSNQCQFVLPSGGDRVFGGTQDNELIFTIPWEKAEAVIGSLEETHKAGFRYPVLTDLRHEPALPPFLQIPKDAE